MIINLAFATITIDTLKKNMTEQRNKIQDYTADIINTIEGSFLQGKKVSTGKIFFQAPDYLRSDSYTPQIQTVLKVKDKTRTIDIQGNVTEVAVEKTSLSDKFKDPTKIFEKFNFTITEIGNNTIKLIGKPISNSEKEIFSSKAFSKIIIYIDEKKYLTKEIRVHDKSNQELIKIVTEHKLVNNIYFPYKHRATITFKGGALQVTTLYSNIAVNEGVSKNLFEIKNIKKQLKDKEH
ncbi:hypothetical protein OAR19_00180 [bacterium]|nr:hypothetical protein [bacterium]